MEPHGRMSFDERYELAQATEFWFVIRWLGSWLFQVFG
jgi:hypothetical protein